MELNQTLKLYHDKNLVKALSQEIHQISKDLGSVKIMHVCGTHEHEIAKYGIRQLLPETISIVPGPGCPVCICPVESIDQAITLAYQDNIIVLTFGDMLRVPATKESLDDARKNGASVNMVYGPLDAIKIALSNPEKKYIFFSIGFETTASGVAGIIKNGVPENLFFLIANRYMPPVLELLMDIHEESIQGFLLAGHAATITGIHAYDFMEQEYKLPCVVCGFEPVDILAAILNLLQQIKNKQSKVINLYKRIVNDNGNEIMLKMLDAVFDLLPGIWRGIDKIDGTAYRLKPKYEFLDATQRFDATPPYQSRAHPPGCQCHRVMLGELLPTDCKMFKSKCSPDDPYGPCMVSHEGTCNSWFINAGNIEL